jgi:hypothetical protein
MRTGPILALIAIFGSAASTNAGDYYQLPGIERIERDLYRSAKVIIKTRACGHWPVDAEDALLDYEGPGKYQILWEDRSTCEVQNVALTEMVPI